MRNRRPASSETTNDPTLVANQDTGSGCAIVRSSDSTGGCADSSLFPDLLF